MQEMTKLDAKGLVKYHQCPTNSCRASTTSTADTVLAVALFKIRPYLVCCMLWAAWAQHLFLMGQSCSRN